MKDQLLAAGLSYLRHAGTCVAALYMSGISDPKILANAFLAGLLGPIMRGLNTSDKTFGVK
jgi:hypothetical protein